MKEFVGIEEMIKEIEKALNKDIKNFITELNHETLKYNFKFNIDKTNLNKDIMDYMKHIEEIGICPNILDYIKNKE
jgi:hypothetical protein